MKLFFLLLALVVLGGCGPKEQHVNFAGNWFCWKERAFELVVIESSIRATVPIFNNAGTQMSCDEKRRSIDANLPKVKP